MRTIVDQSVVEHENSHNRYWPTKIWKSNFSKNIQNLKLRQNRTINWGLSVIWQFFKLISSNLNSHTSPNIRHTLTLHNTNDLKSITKTFLDGNKKISKIFSSIFNRLFPETKTCFPSKKYDFTIFRVCFVKIDEYLYVDFCYSIREFGWVIAVKIERWQHPIIKGIDRLECHWSSNLLFNRWSNYELHKSRLN